MRGPTAAIARKGKDVKLYEPLAGTTTIFQPESFFDMFSFEDGPGKEHVVYYYQSIRTSQAGFFFALVAPGGAVPVGKPKPLVDLELWVLIDDEKGIVIDHAYRQNR